MGQVLKISTTDFRALHLSMGGRLVPSDLLDEARGRELRVSAIESRNVGKSDRDFQRAVNIQYQRATQHVQASLHKSSAAKEINPEALPLTKQKAATPNLYTASNTQRAAAENLEAYAERQALSQEKNAGYLQDRGAFEMRVHQGEITYLPAMNMTIITQMPEVKFEYTGDFVYFPKSPEMGASMDVVS